MTPSSRRFSLWLWLSQIKGALLSRDYRILTGVVVLAFLNASAQTYVSSGPQSKPLVGAARTSTLHKLVDLSKTRLSPLRYTTSRRRSSRGRKCRKDLSSGRSS